MTLPRIIAKFLARDDVNFVLTNRMPRRLVTRLMGRFSRVETPFVRDFSIAIWRAFADLDLNDARETKFRSLHDCFVRRLKEGARPIDPDPRFLISPCDAIVGAFGTVRDGQVFQVKGISYPLAELLCDDALAVSLEGGCYVTLRLTSSMYHHFHAPYDCGVESVTHVPGDVWNVNPPTLRRVERLYCRNERAVIRATLSPSGYSVTLVPVAAILVAGIRLTFLDLVRGAGRVGRARFTGPADFCKGDEMGWFEHGSTIVVFAPIGFHLTANLRVGQTIRMGQQLMHLPQET